MNKYILTFFIALLSFNFTCDTKSSSNFTAYVIAISDGDTIKVLYKKEQIKIRLAHIDCPEKKQPYGNAAKKFISDLVFNKNVKIVTTNEKDRWGRLIAEVYTLNGLNVNKELVKNGYAFHFKKYSKDKSYGKLEKFARKNKLGMWKDKNLVAPWIYRKTKG